MKTLRKPMSVSAAPHQAPGRLPLLGHTLPLLRDPFEFLRALPACGDLVSIRFGPFDAIVVCDPELVHQVLLDDRTFDKGGPVYDLGREFLGDGLGSCPHRLHRRQRQLTQPAFHPQRLRGYTHTMIRHIEAVTSGWNDGQVLDILNELDTISTENLVETLFSQTLPPRLGRQIADDITELLRTGYQRIMIPPRLRRLPTSGNRRYQQARTRLNHAIDAIMTERRADPTDHGDLLSALLAASDPDADNSGLTGTEISDMVITFVVVGIQITPVLTAWALHCLTRHPDIEERLHAEVDEVLAGEPIRPEHLPRLVLTSRIITETLRLHPPGWIFTRIVTTDTDLAGHRLPAGTNLIYSPYLIHHRPDLYEDPERFDPDRWDPEKQPAPPRHAYIPFGAGPRKCIGDTFGLTLATLTLASITARWRLQSLSAHVRPARAIDHRPAGLQIRVIARTP